MTSHRHCLQFQHFEKKNYLKDTQFVRGQGMFNWHVTRKKHTAEVAAMRQAGHAAQSSTRCGHFRNYCTVLA